MESACRAGVKCGRGDRTPGAETRVHAALDVALREPERPPTMFAQHFSVSSNVRSEAPTPDPRLRYLDGLRACAAIVVMLNHAPGFRGSGALGSYSWLYGASHYAVALFIVLSGFSLMLPVVRNDGSLKGGTLRFYCKRARRILPPYYSALALSLVLIYLCIGHKTGTVWDYAVPVTKAGLLTHLILVHDLSHAHEINGALWTISIECQIYLLFPLLVLVWRYANGITTTALTVLAPGVAGLIHGSRVAGMHPQFLGLFALGMLACAIAYSGAADCAAAREWSGWRKVCPLILVVGVCTFARILQSGRGDIERLDALFGILALGRLVGLALGALPHLRTLLELPAVVALGAMSYSLYLIHMPLQALIWKEAVRQLPITDGLHCLLLAALSVLIIVPAAWLFHRACERPFMSTRAPV